MNDFLRRDMPFGPWTLLLIFLPAVAAWVVLGVSTAPLLSILAITIVAYGGIWAAMSEARKAARTEAMAGVDIRLELELVHTVPLAVAPSAIRVIRANGVCALGFRVGSTWTVDHEGHLSSPLCRPAVEALRQSRGLSREHAEAPAISCRCPLGKRSLDFSVTPRAV